MTQLLNAFVTVYYTLLGETKYFDLFVGTDRAKELLRGTACEAECSRSIFRENMSDILYFLSRHDKCSMDDITIVDITKYDPYVRHVNADDIIPDMYPEQPIYISYTADPGRVTEVRRDGIVDLPLDDMGIAPISMTHKFPAGGDNSRLYNGCLQAAMADSICNSISADDIRVEIAEPVSDAYLQTCVRDWYCDNISIYNGQAARTKEEELNRHRRGITDEMLNRQGVTWYGTYYGPCYQYEGQWYEIMQGGVVPIDKPDEAGRESDMMMDEITALKYIHARPEAMTREEALKKSFTHTQESDAVFAAYIQELNRQEEKAAESSKKPNYRYRSDDNWGCIDAWAQLLKESPDKFMDTVRQCMVKHQQEAAE